jgi:transposase
MAVQVRELTSEEEREVRRRAQSRTAPARTVERARIIWELHQGEHVPAVAQRLAISEATVRTWVKRFNTQGLTGLVDHPRDGRQPTYTAEEIGEVIATSLTPPDELGLPFGSWTLDRLTTYLHERGPEAGGPLLISRSHIDRILSGEGLRWRKQETWFGERVDPEFAEKRGRSKRSARRHLRVVSSSTSMKWVQRAPRAILARS